jgi:hypothetical protein
MLMGLVLRMVLLSCRAATVRSITALRCLVLDRKTFTEVLGPYEKVMSEAKSEKVGQTGSRHCPCCCCPSC